MKLVLDATSIFPGESAGIEHIVYGVVPHLHAQVGDGFRLGIPRGTRSAYRSFCAGLPDAVFVEVGPDASGDLRPGTPDAAIPGGGLLASAREAGRRSSLLSGLRSAAAAVSKARELCGRTGPDVALYPFQRVPAVARRSVTVVHDLRPFVSEARSGSSVDRSVIRWNVHHSAALICSWPHPAEHLERLFGRTASGKLSVVPFPPSGVPASSGHDRAGSGGSKDRSVLFASATAPHKNHITLIEAVATARDELGVRLHLYLPGPLSRPTADRLEELIRERRLEEQVDLMGFVTQETLRSLYSSCGVVAVPSLWEAASGAVFDAVAHGRPLVCSDVPPHVSQLRLMGITPPLVPPRDVAAWARALVEACAVEGTNYDVTRGRRFLAELRWDRTAREYLQVCTDAVAAAAESGTCS